MSKPSHNHIQDTNDTEAVFYGENAMLDTKISRREFLSRLLAAMPGISIAPVFAGAAERLKITTLALQDGPQNCIYLHFTDLHFNGDTFLTQKVIDEFHRLKPDFGCFTGDLLDDAAHKDGAFRFIKSLGCPIYGVPGNHDHSCGIPSGDFARAFAETGGGWLVDSGIVTEDGRIEIIGIDNVAARTFDPPRAPHSILLTHYPLAVDMVEERRFAVILAGHSHGGQIRVPLYGSVYLPHWVGKYDRGRFDTRAGVMNVSAGIGTSTLPIRIHCPPEITLVTA